MLGGAGCGGNGSRGDKGGRMRPSDSRLSTGRDVKTAIKPEVDLGYLSIDGRENALLQ